jgi:hypothetical protein
VGVARHGLILEEAVPAAGAEPKRPRVDHGHRATCSKARHGGVTAAVVTA